MGEDKKNETKMKPVACSCGGVFAPSLIGLGLQPAGGMGSVYLSFTCIECGGMAFDWCLEVKGTPRKIRVPSKIIKP